MSKAIATAKSKWGGNLVTKVTNMRMAPKEAWKAVKTLQAGLTGHHQQPPRMSFRKPDGTMSRRDKEHLSILHSHFSRLFNNRKEIDWSVVIDITQ